MQENHEELDEIQAARLIQPALNVPARPLRSDQIDALVHRAQLHWQPVFPLWAILIYTGGLLILGLFGLAGEWRLGSLLDLAWLLPLINVALSPLAAFLIIHRTRTTSQKG